MGVTYVGGGSATLPFFELFQEENEGTREEQKGPNTVTFQRETTPSAKRLELVQQLNHRKYFNFNLKKGKKYSTFYYHQ